MSKDTKENVGGFLNLVCFIPPLHSGTIGKVRIDALLREAKTNYGSYEWRIILIGSNDAREKVVRELRNAYSVSNCNCSRYVESGTGRWRRGNLFYEGKTVELYEIVAFSAKRGLELLEKKFANDAVKSVCAGNRGFYNHVHDKLPEGLVDMLFVYTKESDVEFVNLVWLGAGTDHNGPMQNRLTALLNSLLADYNRYACRLILTGTPKELKSMEELLEMKVSDWGGKYIPNKETDAAERKTIGMLSFHEKGLSEFVVLVYAEKAYSGRENLESVEQFLWDALDTVTAASHWFKRRIGYMIRKLTRADSKTWEKSWTLIESNEKEAFYDRYGIAFYAIHFPGMLSLLDKVVSFLRKRSEKKHDEK